MSEAALKDFPRHLETALRYRDDAYLQGLIEADRRTAETWHAEVDRKDPGIDPQDPWYRPAHDTGDWPPVRVPGSWAGTAVGPIYGAVWYRREIVLPEPLDGKPAELELGRIVHSDVTWVNGVKVGETTYEWPPRRYEIPPGLLHAGTNVIAVRVVSGIDGAGFVEDKPYELRVGSRRFDLTGQWRYHLGAAAERLPPPRFVEWHSPLGFYNAMLAPVVNMTIKGVIWYQGESNVGRAEEYRRLFPAMICEWRGHWGQGDLPFLFVQLANYLEPTSEPVGSAWAELREAQRSALKVPNTAMAVAIDVGVANDIHPTDKKSVGDRLALAARHVAYGEQELVWSGPMFRSIESRSGRLILEFDHTGSGLVARGGPLETFAVAGRDGDWRWAQAKIDGDRVIVWSEDVPDPVAVRYAWADNPVGANLYNREGLPASPFEAKLPPGS
jgi:sialate O-acetylesterase